MIHLEIMRHNSYHASGTIQEIADVTDSLVNANEEAFEDPETYGCELVDELPDWYQPRSEPTPGSAASHQHLSFLAAPALAPG